MNSSIPLNVLVTGGAGFLGRAVAREYQRSGGHVTGIGHGRWTPGEAMAAGYNSWHTADISITTLSRLDGEFDIVIHCAGNGSVPYSMAHPLDAFNQTVQTTADVLEFCRTRSTPPLLIYPSSAAVYGAAADQPLSESAPSNPVSPYGYHKRMAEDLLATYAVHHGVRVAAIRFFSIYGAGLAKQLLWDAANKLSAGARSIAFWGTGEETRDWIHVADAARLIVHVARHTETFTVINGGSGRRVTVREALSTLRDELGSRTEITFNGSVRPGDPRFYHADMTLATKLGWSPAVRLRDGFREYAQWFRMRQ